MHCTKCGFPNPDTAFYCANCGAALTEPASAPPPINAADSQDEIAAVHEAMRRLRRYVPAVVVEGVLHDEARLRGERREVAVLFADAVDFTHLSSSLDAESVFDLINSLLSRLVACVHRYDGLVDKFTGDGLMAVFGAPIAHENDPELAVRAALDMQKAAAGFEPIARVKMGVPLQIRIGIHSGLVTAGVIGTAQQAAYTVIGDAVNLAARVESLAQPGHILVSSRIYQQTQAIFDFQAMGTTQIKGIDRPVALYEAVGDRAEPLPTRGLEGVTKVFLGRDAELGQLRALLAAFLDDRRGRVVVVRGEAGMGKSRLISEGLSTLAPDQVAVWYGHGLPYAQGVGYGIFRSLLQSAVQRQLSSQDQAPDLSWDAHVSPSLRPFLWQMLGQLPPEEQASLRHLEPERAKQLTVLALREWVLGEVRRRPAVLVLEDFHWADDLSRDALKSLGDLIDEAPVLLCVITRAGPEVDLSPPPVEASLAAPRYLSLELKPLSPEHSRMLLAHLVDVDDLPERLVETILTHAEGNPFYIEEFVRMLIEKEVLRLGEGRWEVASTVALQTVEIPTTLRGLMMARVDRLSQDLQDLLRSAAVIGLQFPARLLEEVERRLHGPVAVVPLLERLREQGLLVERPQAGEQVYAFRHIITQETIYRSLLRSQHPGMHRTVAECIETLYAGDLTNQAEVLALHYDRARTRDQAMLYALLAGDRARERFANREAIEYYSRALQLSQHLSGYQAERRQAVIGLGQVEQRIGDYEEAIACYQAALDEWDAVTPRARAQVMLNLGEVWEKRGDLQKAESHLHQALTQLDEAAAVFPALRARIYSALGYLSRRQGDLTAAQEWLEKALALVGATEHYEVLSSILNRLGGLHYNRGEWDKATRCVERALELRQRMGDVGGSARSLNNLAILKHTSGDWDGALADFERAAETHERIGDVEGLSLSYSNLGLLYTDRGEWDKAEKNLRRSFDIAQRIAHPYELAQAHKYLGWLYLLQERWEECARHLKTAIPLYGEAGARASLNLSEAHYFQGILNLEQGQTDTARQWAERCHSLLQETTGDDEGESVEWGRYEQLMGRIAQARGDLVAARLHLERSADIFRASGSQIEVGRTAYWSGLLSLELEERERAGKELLAARQVFERLGAAADLRRVEGQLARFEPPG